MIEIREATAEDWPALQASFLANYRAGHPLHRRDFWEWQHLKNGRSFVAFDDGRVVAHWGAHHSGGLSWCMNLYAAESMRGKGFLRRACELARSYYPVASANVNDIALEAFRKMGWIRYYDLQRYVLVRPGLEPSVETVAFSEMPKPTGHHYWSQPGLVGAVLSDGSTGVLQGNVGGIRIVEIASSTSVAEAAWAAGAHWIDYITSWNDPLGPELASLGWRTDDPIPFYLNPVKWGSRGHLSFVSEMPLPNDFIVRRYHSDHGRVASLEPLP